MAGLEDFNSIKGFDTAKDEVIERKKMGRLLEAGRHAPSPGNVHTVEFVVVEDHGKLDHLSEVVGDTRVHKAPTSVVVLCDPNRMSRRVDNEMEACFAEVSASVQNMRILANSEGLCTNLVMGFDSTAVANLIDCPDSKIPLAVLSFAYSDNPTDSSDRFGLNEICFYNEYGNQIGSVFDGWEWEGIHEEREVYTKKLRGLVKKLKDRI
ncbi:MAG: nitroreductase family protein [Candidatus Nanohaloarchaea archaeon]